MYNAALEPWPLETLDGTINRLIYRDPDGYAVVELAVEGRLLPVTVVGTLPGVQVGERLSARGSWTEHPRFGRQFKALEFDALMPSSIEGLSRYLASGAINGIGPALATRLVEAFGAELFEVAEQTPQRLTEVSGIGAKRAKALAGAIVEQRAVREVMVFLSSLGLGPGIAGRIYRVWGKETLRKLKADPYRLVREVDGIGFATADAIAGKVGIGPDSPSRTAAGLLHLARASTDAGDTVRPREQLIAEAAAFLSRDVDAIAESLEGLVRDGVLVERSAESGDAEDPQPEVVVGQPWLVAAETAIGRRLAAMLGRRPRQVSEREVEQVAGLELTDEQLAAVRNAAQGPLAIITGGPGTGKTTVLRTLVQLLERREEKVYLCAPTGRAAKRMSEATGARASTVHRLLGFSGGGFEHGRHNPLEPGTVVVDEASMVDVPLMHSLLEALPDEGSLVLVGDQDQLPSVGPGNVLGDQIDSDTVPVTRLGTVFRQAASSRIVANAHRIRQGELPQSSPGGAHEDGEFHIVRVDDPQRAQQLVLQVCCERIPDAFGLDPLRDVQVLSPMHRAQVGTVALNSLLQARLNPSGAALKRGNDELRVGDKVMQVRNDYDRDVFNGDIGRVIAIDAEEGTLEVEINGNCVEYAADQINQLALAYCVSIHKSQGSEYPAVVIPLLTQHYMLLQRNLLYTAVTRARQLVVLVASPKALRIAVERVDRARRRTLLRDQLVRQILG